MGCPVSQHSCSPELYSSRDFGYKEKVFYNEGDEAMEQVAQRGGGPVLGDIEGKAEMGSEHPDLSVGFPVHCRGVGLNGL